VHFFRFVKAQRIGCLPLSPIPSPDEAFRIAENIHRPQPKNMELWKQWRLFLEHKAKKNKKY